MLRHGITPLSQQQQQRPRAPVSKPRPTAHGSIPASSHAKALGFAQLVATGRRCRSPATCPCCGSCLEAFAVLPGVGEAGVCAVCAARARHRWNCFTLAVDPPLALLNPSASPVVAYFGPHKQHAEALERHFPKIRLKRFDLFATGFETLSYARAYTANTLRADVQAIPARRSGLDGVIILHVLEHVVNLTLAVSELRRVVRRGGFVEHETPCYYAGDPATPSYAQGSVAFECAKGLRKDRICKQEDHLFAYSCEHLRRTFWAAGFQCRSTVANLSYADYKRFLSVGDTAVDKYMYTARARRGRFRCVK